MSMNTWVRCPVLMQICVRIAFAVRRDVAATRGRYHEMQTKIQTVVEGIYSNLAGPNPPPTRS